MSGQSMSPKKLLDLEILFRKTQLCAPVVLAEMSGDHSQIKESMAALTSALGSNWSVKNAQQFMSGKDAKSSLESFPIAERVAILTAHHEARRISSKQGLGAVTAPDGIDEAELQALKWYCATA